MVSITAFVHTLFALHFLLSPRDLKCQYFIRKVMLGFIESNSNIVFTIADIVIRLFEFVVMYFTKF